MRGLSRLAGSLLLLLCAAVSASAQDRSDRSFQNGQPNVGVQSNDQDNNKDNGHGYELLWAGKGAASARSTASLPRLVAPPDLITGFDVLHYRLDLEIDPVARTVAGDVDVTFTPTTGPLDSLLLYLEDTRMMVGSVTMNAVPLSYSHTMHRIHIDLGATFTSGDTITVRVSYSGEPLPQGLRFTPQAIFNLSEPDMARNWFPCYDEPWDKATSETIVTVPDNLYCASNGLLVSETDNLDGTKTYHWNTRYAHSTYLTSVAISDYLQFSHWYHYAPGDSMEMPYYVYPSKWAAAQISFSEAPAMMEFFASTFAEYPFIEERYGTALGEVGGAMENITCTTYGSSLVNGLHNYDWVVAHEMAHSWFGNSVTLADWPDVWLNEGFATYGDALWHEHIGGTSRLNSRMSTFRSQYFSEDAGSRFPIYDPLNLWGATVYQKGAWILHMLRYVLGDSMFFDGLRAYYQTFAHGNATTEEFRSVMESTSGTDLATFFNEWVYQAGYPEYEFSWTDYDDGAAHIVSLTIQQVQLNAPVFTIPIEVQVTTTSGDSLFRLPVASAHETYQLALADAPLDVTFDPGVHVLKKVSEIMTGITETHPPSLSARVFPNPASGNVRLDVFVAQAGEIEVDVYDAAGRFVDRLVQPGLPSVWNSFLLRRKEMAPGPSGVYFYRVRAGQETAVGKFVLIK